MPYLDETGLSTFWTKIKTWASTNFGRSLSKGTSTTSGLPIYLKDNAATPNTLSTLTITKSDITALGIPGSDTNTDTKVTQNLDETTSNYVYLLGAGVSTDSSGTVKRFSGIKWSPNWGTLQIGDESILINGADSTIQLGDVVLSDSGLSWDYVIDAPDFLTEHQSLAAYATKASPALTGTPTAPTATAGTNTTQIATTAFVSTAVSNAVMGAITGAAIYKGGITPTSYTSLSDYTQGWYWVVTTAGTIAGETCEVGDMVFCNTSKGSNTKSAAHFDVVQANITAILDSTINALS